MFVERILYRIATTRRRRQVSMELSSLGEYQLQDLGISRLDLIGGKRGR